MLSSYLVYMVNGTAGTKGDRRNLSGPSFLQQKKKIKEENLL